MAALFFLQLTPSSIAIHAMAKLPYIVSSRCQLNRGNLPVGVQRLVRFAMKSLTDTHFEADYELKPPVLKPNILWLFIEATLHRLPLLQWLKATAEARCFKRLILLVVTWRDRRSYTNNHKRHGPERSPLTLMHQ